MPSHPRRKYPPVHDNKRDAAMSGRPRLVGTPLSIEERIDQAVDRVFEALRQLGRHPSDGCLLLAAICRQRELDGLLKLASAAGEELKHQQRVAAARLARAAKTEKNRVTGEANNLHRGRPRGRPEAIPSISLDPTGTTGD